ncbi:co-chaperone GroES [uncultured Ilyobacter sp.]|uniref:co-chaperone GroES n=1 Tax=uncultured Ilyobacter sp. TaxID=544433 RepID=UPI0029BFEA60|nr:co-chaperone GroES [uncultured Ilyobacter sp.]
MNIKPIGKRLLVKPLKMEEKTSSGIILPSSENKTVPNMGEVVAIGAVDEIKTGEKIVYKKFSGTEITDSEEKYLILEMEDVLAVAE